MTTYKGIGFDGGDFDPTLYPWLTGSVTGAYDPAAGQGLLFGGHDVSHGNGTLPDSRLYGAEGWSTQVYRYDIDNGTYTFRCAVGNVNISGAASLVIDNDDGAAIVLNSGASIDIHQVLVADNTVMSDTDWIASNGGLGGGPGVSVSVTKGYVLLYADEGTTGNPRIVQFESSGVTLEDATLATDHTNYTATATGGVTTIGSAVVTGLSSTSGMKTGMRFDASSVPYGRTILSVDSGSQVTLNDGTGVTAATGLAVRVGYSVTLYEASPANAVIAPITLVNGPRDGLIVYEADGTTVSPYIKAVKVGSQPWLGYSTTPLPGATPHAFKIYQPNGSDTPHTTSISLPVIAAPNKLADAAVRPVLAKMLTPNYLRRKNTLDTIESGKWHGYKGQAFEASVTVYSISQLLDQMNTFQSSAGVNKWFHIRLGTGSGSDDWASDSSGWNSTGFDFKPALGGGLLITNAPTQQPAITGGIYTAEPCGLQFGLLGAYAGIANSPILLATDTGAPCWRGDGHNVDAATTIIFENVWFGSLANPANSGDSMSTTADKAGWGLGFNYVGEQLTVRNCRFLGTALGIIAIACRRVEILDNEFAVLNDDCIRIGALVHPYGRWGTSGLLDGTGGDDVFYNIARNTQHRQIDIADTIGWSGVNWGDPHWDVIQVQTQTFFFDATGCTTTAGSAVVPGIPSTTGMLAGQVFDCPTVPLGRTIASVDSGTQITLASGAGVTAGSSLPAAARTYTGCIHIVNEDWTVVNKVSTISVCPSDSSRVGFPVRQFFEPSDVCPIYGSFNNNMAGNSAKAGLDFGNGIGFAEFNSFGGSAQMPSSTVDAVVQSIQEIFSRNDELKGAPNCNYSRLNIAHAVSNNLGISLFSEGDVVADFADDGTTETRPGAVMAGTFTQDGDRTGRWVYSIDDTLSADDLRKAFYDTFKPKAGVLAGVSELHLRLNPGDMATLSNSHAGSLNAITDGEPIATGAEGASATWHRGASETGPTDGIDLTYGVI
jgi:hypothetical protein